MYRTLLRQFRRSASTSTAGTAHILSLKSQHLPQNPNQLIAIRSYAFTSAEEAAAERRRRKRRMRIEPPMWALRRDPPSQSQQRYAPMGPPLPDSTSSLTGPRLNLHNRVQSLIRAGDLDSASAVARHAVFSNVRPTVFTCNAIIAAMNRASRYTDSKNLFQYFFNQSSIIPNIVSYNNLILSHFGNGDVEEAIEVYNQILREAPFAPSSFTYRHITKGLIDAGRIDEAVGFLREMLAKGQGADSLVYNNIIYGFLELGNLDRANEFFEELQERCLVYDGVVSATFMDWFFKQGREKEAMEAYKYLMSKQFRMIPATCNVLLEVLVRHGKEKEAWDLFNNMLDNHTPPSFQAVNSDTFNIMVNECFRLGKVSEAMEVFKKVGKAEKSRPFAMDVAGFNNMIVRLCEAEKLEEAEGYFAQLQSKSLSPDVTTFRTFIDAYIKADKVDETLEKYRMMVVAGLRVIPAYADKWFSFLIEKGKVEECVPILMKMCEREPKPDVTTFEIVIRGLCGVGELEACSYVVTQMITFGVGVTPALKEFLLHVFEKEGKLDVMEKIVNARFPFYPPPQPPAPQNPDKVPAWRVPLATPASGMTSFSLSPQNPTQVPPAGPQRPWQSSVSPPLPSQAAAGATQMSWQGSASSGMPGQSPAGASQMQVQASFTAQAPTASQGTWQASVSSHNPGQTSPAASQMPWQASVSCHNQGQTSPAAPRTSEMPWQASVSPQMPKHASFPSHSPGHAPGASQMQWQQPPGASQMQWQQPPGASQMQWQTSSPQAPGASQVPWQTSYSPQAQRASPMPWQASTSPQAPASSQMPTTSSPQAPASSQMPTTSSPQAAGAAQMPWQTSFSPQMPEQAAAPSQMPEQVVTHQMRN